MDSVPGAGDERPAKMNAVPTGRDRARARSARAAELRRNFHASRVYPSPERVRVQARVSGVVPRTSPRRYTLGELTTMIDQEVKNVNDVCDESRRRGVEQEIIMCMASLQEKEPGGLTRLRGRR